MIRGIGWALLATLALPTASVLAQTQTQTPDVPTRNGNVYNGTAHEPNPSATTQQEQSTGVALSPQQQQQQTGTLEQLDKQIQQRAGMPLGTAAGCTADQQRCPP